MLVYTFLVAPVLILLLWAAKTPEDIAKALGIDIPNEIK